MKITTRTSLGRDAKEAAVLVQSIDSPVSKHPFYGEFSNEDQSYIEQVWKSCEKMGEGSLVVLTPSGRRVFLLGIGDRKKFAHRKAIILARKIVTLARREKTEKLVLSLDDFTTHNAKFDPEELAEIIATQLEIANFEFVQYRTAPKDGWIFVKEIALVGSSRNKVENGVVVGTILGEEINNARNLINTPGADMNPEAFALKAKQAGKKNGFSVRVLDEKQIEKLGMGGVIGVGKGSTSKPRFVILEYRHGSRSEKPVVLVGKGVTFDSGGLNIKPGDFMYEMHMDMSGAAAVLHVITACARLKQKKNLIGLIPLVENMPSGNSYRPGDVLKSLSGKTIEVMNTDAEGRVILADAITYAKKYNPSLVIDIATLTGAAAVALGQRTSALFSTDQTISKKMIEAGEEVSDLVWPLPLWEDYEEEIKGTFGDVSNMGKTRYGGAITAAVFLWQFIKDTPWVHLDIAPRMTSIEGEYLARGAAGASIALLFQFLKK